MSDVKAPSREQRDRAISATDPIVGYVQVLRCAAKLLHDGEVKHWTPDTLPSSWMLARCEAAAIASACRRMEDQFDPHAVALLRTGLNRGVAAPAALISNGCIDAYADLVMEGAGITAKDFDHAADDPKRDCELTAAANLKAAASVMVRRNAVSSVTWAKGNKIVGIVRND